MSNTKSVITLENHRKIDYLATTNSANPANERRIR